MAYFDVINGIVSILNNRIIKMIFIVYSFHLTTEILGSSGLSYSVFNFGTKISWVFNSQPNFFKNQVLKIKEQKITLFE